MIFKSMLECIDDLHRRKYNKIHRDLKPENIYMQDLQLLTVKLADFGLANARLQWYNNLTRFSKCGTHHYMAPELFSEESYD